MRRGIWSSIDSDPAGRAKRATWNNLWKAWSWSGPGRRMVCGWNGLARRGPSPLSYGCHGWASNIVHKGWCGRCTMRPWLPGRRKSCAVTTRSAFPLARVTGCSRIVRSRLLPEKLCLLPPPGSQRVRAMCRMPVRAWSRVNVRSDRPLKRRICRLCSMNGARHGGNPAMTTWWRLLSVSRGHLAATKLSIPAGSVRKVVACGAHPKAIGFPMQNSSRRA